MSRKTSKQRLRAIAKRGVRIVSRIDPETVAAYRFLRHTYKKDTKAHDDPLFRFVYRRFFGLQRFADDNFTQAYFKQLGAMRGKAVTCETTEQVVEALRRKPSDKRHRSFVSKLVHMVNPDMPIWDANVRNALDLKQFEPGYRELCELVQNAVNGNEWTQACRAFHQRFPGRRISKAKIIDFILWTDGAGKTKRAK